MKSFFLKGLTVAAFAIVTGYNVYQSNSKTEGMSELMLANVEALAYSVENGDEEFECEAPFNNTCAVILGQVFPGYKLEYGY